MNYDLKPLKQPRDALLLTEVITTLRQTLDDNLIALVLFGSRARGAARPDSDWDLLLVARDLPPPGLARHTYVKTMLPLTWRGRVAVLAKTKAEFESAVSPLFLDIALDGIILWDTSGYMAKRLAYLRKLLGERGLYREQRGSDLVWLWRTFPGYGWQLKWEEAI